MGSETGAQLGVVGLAVMGRNLALNVLDHGYTVVGYNRSPELVAQAVAESGDRLVGTGSLVELVEALERPRKIMMMVKAGEPVDAVMGQLQPILEPGDIVIDGGNSWYMDTRRREKQYADAGLHFFGVGVSGGEEGARYGPSIMPGGNREAYQLIRPIFESIAAKTDSGPCVTYVGPDGAGHFVKMVHNGIEYADMQFIAEIYDLLRRVGRLGAEELADVFRKWNQGPLESFLIELTAEILTVRDENTGGFLVDQVLDKAGQKGTGRWTVQVALELGVSVPCIAAAVDARLLSSQKEKRQIASGILEGPIPPPDASDTDTLVEKAHDALYAAKIVDYAQGLDLISTASDEYDWSIGLGEVARIWKGGCIIRARLLDSIMRAYTSQKDLPNLLLDEKFSQSVHSLQPGWREVVSLAQLHGVPVGGLASSLAYYDSYRTEDLPQSLTQAQRDAFGAHTYQRKDDPDGEFVHSDWLGQSSE